MNSPDRDNDHENPKVSGFFLKKALVSLAPSKKQCNIKWFWTSRKKTATDEFCLFYTSSRRVLKIKVCLRKYKTKKQKPL